MMEEPAEKRWCASRVICHICGYKQVSVYPAEADCAALECASCRNMSGVAQPEPVEIDKDANKAGVEILIRDLTIQWLREDLEAERSRRKDDDRP